jgi:plastocyanin
MNSFFILLGISAFSLILTMESAYAASYDIIMPSGSASPDAPFFWQNEKSGQATGDIEIVVGDTVIWKNGDTAKHTITSGTVEDGPDGKFGGTDFLVPGQFYKFTFTEKGRFPYFCLIHPWMTGVVTVTSPGFQLIPDVGKSAGDGLTSFNVDYQFNGKISKTTINEDKNSITFDIVSDSKAFDHTLLIMIPSGLIQGPYAIFVDGTKNLNFELTESDVNTIKIELPENAKQMTIVGTKVVPEFGLLSVVVFGTAITTAILFHKSQIRFQK